jgi:hypothetical protein
MLIDLKTERFNRSHAGHEGWDGRFKGEPCVQGSYVWIIRFTDADRIYSER